VLDDPHHVDGAARDDLNRCPLIHRHRRARAHEERCGSSAAVSPGWRQAQKQQQQHQKQRRRSSSHSSSANPPSPIVSTLYALWLSTMLSNTKYNLRTAVSEVFQLERRSAAKLHHLSNMRTTLSAPIVAESVVNPTMSKYSSAICRVAESWSTDLPAREIQMQIQNILVTPVKPATSC
jgi:hypothetical protein